MRMRLDTDSNRMENMFVYFFSFSILSRHRRQGSGIVNQNIDLTVLFNNTVCNFTCNSPSYVGNLTTFPQTFTIPIGNQTVTLNSTVQFNSNPGKWNT
jgi:hypothetical protein